MKTKAFEYKIGKYSLEEYVGFGGKPQKHFKPSTMYFLAMQGNKIIGELAFIKDFFDCSEAHYFILDTKSHIEGKGVGTNLVSAVELDAVKNDLFFVALKFKHNSDSVFWKNRDYYIDPEDNSALKRFKSSS